MAAKKRGSLRRLFRNAVIGSALAVASYPAIIEVSAWQEDQDRTGGTSLTDGEVTLARGIFGDEINTSVVRKHFSQARPGIAASVALASRRHIDFWGKRYHSEDYSDDTRWSMAHLYMHEMTHIWQQQNHLIVYNFLFKKCDTYDYTLTEGSHFDDFCNEQQAEIVADYVMQIMYPHIYFLNDGEENRRHRARVVEEQFPEARRMREKSYQFQKNPYIPGAYEKLEFRY